MLLASLILLLIKDTNQLKLLTSNKNVFWVSSFLFLFVLYGISLGFPLDRFMKFIETMLAFITFSIYIKDFYLLKKYSIYFIISSILLVASLSNNIQTRFIFEDDLSNDVKADPSLLGLSLVLSALFLIIDNSRWVEYFANNSYIKFKNILIISILILLVLTTSRIGILTLLGSLFFWALIKKNKIKKLIPLTTSIIVSLIFIIISPYAALVEIWYNKTFNNTNGIAGATTGRSNQWEMAVNYLFSSDFFTIFFGYGPGKGPEFSKKYSLLIDSIDSIYGKGFELHSFYLNIFVEFGLFAFILFVLFIIKRFIILIKLSTIGKTDFPIVVMMVYLIYILSVSGLGLVSGILIAIFSRSYNLKQINTELLSTKNVFGNF
jgi:O-antigen ligase